MKSAPAELALPIILDSAASPPQPCLEGFAGLTAAERAAHAEIVHRAHSIWECAGRPENCELAHWLAAEAEVLGQA